MSDQNFYSSHPTWLFQIAALLSLCAPCGVIIILYFYATPTGESLFDTLAFLAKTYPTFYVYMFIFCGISLTLWNIRLHISPCKIEYRVFGLPTLWKIHQHEVAYCQINPKFDAPYTLLRRKFNRFPTAETELQFNQRHGTIEFHFRQNGLRYKIKSIWSLIYLSGFSAKQSQQIVAVLTRYWHLKDQT